MFYEMSYLLLTHARHGSLFIAFITLFIAQCFSTTLHVSVLSETVTTKKCIFTLLIKTSI